MEQTELLKNLQDLKKKMNPNFELTEKNGIIICRYKAKANFLVMLLGIIMTGTFGYLLFDYYQEHAKLFPELHYYAGLFLGLFMIFFTMTKRAKWVKIDLQQKKLEYYKKDKKLSSEAFSEIKNIRMVTNYQSFISMSSTIELVTPTGKKPIAVFRTKKNSRECVKIFQDLLGLGLEVKDVEWTVR